MSPAGTLRCKFLSSSSATCRTNLPVTRSLTCGSFYRPFLQRPPPGQPSSPEEKPVSCRNPPYFRVSGVTVASRQT
jgi:hypothetical protein